MRGLTVALAFAYAVGASGCLVGEPLVVRVSHGKPRAGRAVSGAAYAAYARGAWLEASGDDVGALAAFEEASREDPDSPDVATRVARDLVVSPHRRGGQAHRRRAARPHGSMRRAAPR